MVTKVIRRIHMYLALFLMPWMLVYAISTMSMNHHQWVAKWYSTKRPAYTVVKETKYDKSFSEDVKPEVLSKTVLQDLDLDGTHNVRGGEGKPYVITRLDPIALKRITYDPNHNSVVVEQEEFRAQAFLDRLHRRRGYRFDYLLEDTWGFTVDLAIIAMLFWCLSGIWIWWEMKAVRKWGTISLVSGLALFALFLVLI